MPAERFAAALNEQVANEFAASHQYVAVAAFYESRTLPQLASFFYEQALEEREHAMMMIKYLLDTGAAVRMREVTAPLADFDDHIAPIRSALEQEQRVSDQISELFRTAREEGDYLSEQFVQWFLKEQVEEVASMSDLLRVVERAREDPMRAEDYLARETVGDGGQPTADPTAPEVAGGAL